ncbi:coiled-coil domain-containing protein mad1 [Kappamyces sp. JEL0829]|nr:coiled-coil domain-containing protein mad1 [Kappamyces sp. JEL0829]
MAQLVSKLTKQIYALKDELGTATASRKSSQLVEAELQTKIKQLETQLEDTTNQLALSRSHATRLELAQTLSQREVGFLKESLASYDMEERQMSPNFDLLKQQRLAELEATLVEYKVRGTQLEGELKAGIHRENEHLTRLVDELERKVEQLQDKLGSGMYNPATTRVLQLQDNPEANIINARKEMIDTLRAENERLHSQLRDGHGASSQIPEESYNALKTQLAQLESDLNSRETLILRLKQVFGAKIQGYRQFVQDALGFQVEMLPDDESFRLHSTLDQRQSFEVSNGEIRGTGYSTEIREILQHYVGQYQSIPAFLAKITLMLDKYEKLLERFTELQEDHTDQLVLYSDTVASLEAKLREKSQAIAQFESSRTPHCSGCTNLAYYLEREKVSAQRVEKARDQIAALQDKLSVLMLEKKQVEQLQAEIGAKSKKIGELEITVAKLRSQLILSSASQAKIEELARNQCDYLEAIKRLEKIASRSQKREHRQRCKSEETKWLKAREMYVQETQQSLLKTKKIQELWDMLGEKNSEIRSLRNRLLETRLK